MDQITSFLDSLYFLVITPLVTVCTQALEAVLITPFVRLHLPVPLHLLLLAFLLATFSFSMRRLLRVEQKSQDFNLAFAAKRAKQQDLQLIPDKYSRRALYRVTDEELNEEYNRFLAGHYARYVSIYLLPLFLFLAWLNTFFTPEFLMLYHDSPFALNLEVTRLGVKGLNVTFCFLVAYIGFLILGFQGKRLFTEKKDKH